jgi:RNA polymerase sigma-70 factor, ECF subfamily
MENQRLGIEPDADVIELARNGERDVALRRLFERYGRAVYSACHRTLGDGARAEDVQQRVFIEVHRDLPTFAARSRLRTWLFGIVRHRVLDELKRQARSEDRSAHWRIGCDPDLADAGPLPDRRLDDARLQAALLACVAELPPKVQRALLLRFQRGLSFEEMAKLSGEKACTLQARVSRTVERLRKKVAHRIHLPALRVEPRGESSP